MATSRAGRACRASLVALVLVFAALLPLRNAHADQVIHTADNTTNSIGQPVKASASFTIFPDRVLVRLTNHTPFLKSPEQALRGISFRVRTNKPLDAHLGKSAAKVRMITPDGIKDSKDPIDVPWRLRIDGNAVNIESPSRKFALLSEPPPQGKGHYPQAEPGLTDPSNNPYLSGTIVMEVVFPGSPLTYGITEVFFVFENATGLAASADRSLSSPSSNSGNPLIEIPDDDATTPETGVPLVPGETIWEPEGPFVPVLFPPSFPPTDSINPLAPPPPVTDSRDEDNTPQPPLSNGPEQPENPNPVIEPPPTGNLPEIPEPTSLAFLALGAATILLRRQK